MATIRLFVYGSLRRGRSNHERLKQAQFLGAASTAAGRYQVVPLGRYPALIETAGAGPSVSGELYEVGAALLAELDEFEGVPTLYCRRPIALSDGSHAEAYFKAASEKAGSRGI